MNWAGLAWAPVSGSGPGVRNTVCRSGDPARRWLMVRQSGCLVSIGHRNGSAHISSGGNCAGRGDPRSDPGNRQQRAGGLDSTTDCTTEIEEHD